MAYHESDVDNLVCLEENTDIVFVVDDYGHGVYKIAPYSDSLIPVSDIEQMPYDTWRFEMGLRNIQEVSETIIMASVVLTTDSFELVADNIEIELDNPCSFNLALLH